MFRDALERYKQFHAAQVKLLRQLKEDGDIVGKSNKFIPRTLNFVCNYKSGCSGLGDQLQHIPLFLLMAMVSDRVLTINWDEDFKVTTQYLIPNELQWDVFDQTLGMCVSHDNTKYNDHCSRVTFSRASMLRKGWNQHDWAVFGRALFSPEPHITFIGVVNLGTMMLANETILQPNTLMRDRFEDIGVTKILALDMDNKLDFDDTYMLFTKVRNWYTASWFYMSRIIFNYLFRLSGEVTMEAEKIAKAMGNRYLAVHLRTGFRDESLQWTIEAWAFKNWKLFPGKKSWKCFMDHAIALANENIGEKSNIYLATDSHTAKDWIAETYGERIIMTNKTVKHSAELKLAHCEENSGSLGFWIDFYLLGHAYYLVHGSSMYAMSASMMCATPPLQHSWVAYEDSTHTCYAHIGTNVTIISP